MTNATDPASMKRRSQLYRWHRARGASFVERFDTPFVDSYSNAGDEAEAARRLGICDLSLLPRDGINGRGSIAWLRDNGHELPEQPNTSVAQANGDLLVRLSNQEFLNLGLSSLFGEAGPNDKPVWLGNSEREAFAIPRADSHCLFAVSGEHTAAMFAKLCGVDLRPDYHNNGGVAQTSVARVNAIVIRQDLQQTPNFYLLTATSAAEYLWECLIDAIDEFEGRPIGVSALQAIAE